MPLSLVGTFGVMYLLGYSLNNLTLMALTISTGFVVDDAIVMIENIARYVEEGMPPLEAALRGLGADRLHHPLADGVADRGTDSPALHGRHRRPPVPRVRGHAQRHDSGIGGRLADADADDVREAAASARRRSTERVRTRARSGVRIGHRVSTAARCGGCSRTRPPTLVVAVATLALTVALYVLIPKGFFPVAGYRRHHGRLGGGADDLVCRMAERQQALANVILHDPAVESLSSFIGIDGTNTTLNSGRIQINLKPLERTRR